MFVYYFGCMFLLLLLPCLLQAFVLGEVPPPVTIGGEAGGHMDGATWNSSEIKGKVYCLLYVDPDSRDLNKPLFDTLTKAAFPREQYGFIAVVNLKATIVPNFIIEAKLKKSQKKHPLAVYIRDREKVLMSAWGMADHNSDIVLFDRQGRVLFWKDGRLSEEEIGLVLDLIRKNIALPSR